MRYYYSSSVACRASCCGGAAAGGLNSCCFPGAENEERNSRHLGFPLVLSAAVSSFSLFSYWLDQAWLDILL